MLSPELMGYIIKYQDKESLYQDKKEETKEIEFSNNYSSKLAEVTIELMR